jgi:hypothetical protein
VTPNKEWRANRYRRTGAALKTEDVQNRSFDAEGDARYPGA